MNTAISDAKHPTANKLLYIAWAIEIIAALVSLLIGIFLIFGDTGLTTHKFKNFSYHFFIEQVLSPKLDWH